MTSKKLGIVLGVWLIGIAMVGGGFYLTQSKPNLLPLEKPVINGVVMDKPIVEGTPVTLPSSELGQPSSGVNQIDQAIVPEKDNPYSMTDLESVRNFNQSTEGQFLQMLFARLNSRTDTVVTQSLTHLTDSELTAAIQIDPDLQQMLYGYKTNDDPKHFLFDDNLMHQFRPHAALLHYIQSVRPDETYQARLCGYILPKVSNSIPTMLKVTIGNRDVMYLVRESVGTCLVESNGPEMKHYEVSFRFNLGIPHDVQSEGYPLLLWPDNLQITMKPINDTVWKTEKKGFYVKG
jgi:hypothetical protein